MLTLFRLVRKTITCSKNSIQIIQKVFAYLLLPRSCKCNPPEFRFDFFILLLLKKSRFCWLQFSRCACFYYLFVDIFQNCSANQLGETKFGVFKCLSDQFYDFLPLIEIIMVVCSCMN